MTAPKIDEAPCVQHERGDKCGTTWYSFTAHGHTVGICDRKGRKFTGKVDTDKKTGQVTLTLVDADGVGVSAIAFVPA